MDLLLQGPELSVFLLVLMGDIVLLYRLVKRKVLGYDMVEDGGIDVRAGGNGGEYFSEVGISVSLYVHLLKTSAITFSFPLMCSILKLNWLIVSLHLLNISDSEICCMNVSSGL